MITAKEQDRLDAIEYLAWQLYLDKEQDPLDYWYDVPQSVRIHYMGLVDD